MLLSTTLNIFSLRRDGNDPARALEGIWACKEAGFDAVDFHFNEIDRVLTHDEQDAFIEDAKKILKESGMPIS
ncbi:MAG: sugar phosphate isomerase/epimerase, partial [Clostridia bacterium]|nr:sugar phosphate isomerase/epimerase [Clostridia bacterium]